MTPTCWPVSSMRRTSGTRIRSLIRVVSRSGRRRSNLRGTGTSCGCGASNGARWRLCEADQLGKPSAHPPLRELNLSGARARSGGMHLHLLAAAAVTAATASVAHADGLPVGNLDTTSTGVSVPGSSDRFFAIQSGRQTVVASVYRDGGLLQGHATLPGAFTVPAVAQDGTTSGLSANGRTLVLVRPRLAYPQRRTRLAVLSAPSLRLRATIVLRGDFSVDAISPDGRR